MICWTLGITEHHNAVDNVLALINLVLLTGHVGRYGSGLNPLRGQNNVQGGGDMGALPNRLPGFQHVENDALRAKFDEAWGVTVPPKRGWHLSEMFDAMERGELQAIYVIGENPLQSEADQTRAKHLLETREFMVVQDIFLTATAELADVVLPAAAAWAESEGTVTNSERRVQRVRKALDPPGEARDDLWIIYELARRMGHDWGSPVGRGRLERGPVAVAGPRRDVATSGSRSSAGSSGRATTRTTPASCSSTAGSGRTRCPGNRVPFVRGRARPAGRPARRRLPDPADDRPPPRLVQHRRPDRRLHLAAPPRRVARHLAGGRRAPTGSPTASGSASSSRRGQVEVPIRIDESLRPGLTFMTLHFQDDVATNLLTIDATDPKSGTAEFKATAIRIEKLPATSEAAVRDRDDRPGPDQHRHDRRRATSPGPSGSTRRSAGSAARPRWTRSPGSGRPTPTSGIFGWNDLAEDAHLDGRDAAARSAGSRSRSTSRRARWSTRRSPRRVGGRRHGPEARHRPAVRLRRLLRRPRRASVGGLLQRGLPVRARRPDRHRLSRSGQAGDYDRPAQRPGAAARESRCRT